MIKREGQSIILVSGFVSDASCPFHQLFAFVLSGKKLWDADGYHDRIFTASDFTFTTGYTLIDDVIGYEQIVFSMFDKKKGNIFRTGYPGIPDDYYFSARRFEDGIRNQN